MQWLTSLLIAVNLILNGDFSDGLNHWIAEPGWVGKNNKAVLILTNPEPDDTLGARLCSKPYPIPLRAHLSGAMKVQQRSPWETGYVFVGVEYYDSAKMRQWSYLIVSTENDTSGNWQNLSFTTRAEGDSAYVALCAWAGAYGGQTLRARVDNASLTVR